MMTRFGRVVRAVLLLPILVLLVGFVPASRKTPHPAPPTPAYSPPPSEPSPFSRADAFCVPEIDRFDAVAPTDPRVRAHPVEVVWLARGEGTTGVVDETGAVEQFARLIDECGGIGGRPLELHVVHGSADPRADCAAAVTRFHPDVVVSTSTLPAWSCIVRDEKTVLVTGSDTSNADFRGSGGRLVATGSSEGVEQARLLGLVDSGRLADRKAAIVAGDDPTGVEFRRVARAALSSADIRPVDLANADAVLVPSLDLSALPVLDASTAAARQGRALDVYGFETASSSVPAALDRLEPAAAAKLQRSVQLYAFSPVADPRYRASQSPNTFSDMCNRAAVDAVTKRADATTSTTAPQPPLSAAYLTTADVCLLMRVVARGLFAAGPEPDQRAVITALHRLPYVDQAAPGGTPKPRPNQVVNEPVRRIEQVVVLTQVQLACSSETTTTTHPTGVAGTDACWMPASGWDDGGRVVNVPPPSAAVAVSH